MEKKEGVGDVKECLSVEELLELFERALAVLRNAENVNEKIVTQMGTILVAFVRLHNRMEVLEEDLRSRRDGNDRGD